MEESVLEFFNMMPLLTPFIIHAGIFDKGWNPFLLSELFIPFVGFLVAHMIKNLPAMQENLGLIPELGRSLEEGMATYSSILAWRIPWTEEPGRL